MRPARRSDLMIIPLVFANRVLKYLRKLLLIRKDKCHYINKLWRGVAICPFSTLNIIMLSAANHLLSYLGRIIHLAFSYKC